MASRDLYSKQAVSREKPSMPYYLGFVMPIFGAMLLLTGLVIFLMILTNTAGFILQYPAVYVLLGFSLSILYLLAYYFQDAYPLNGIFTIPIIIIVGVLLAPIIQGFANAGMGHIVAQAFVATAIVFFGFFAIPILTGKDFSSLRAYLVPMFLALGGFAFLGSVGSVVLVGFNLGVIVVLGLFVLYHTSKIIEEDYGPFTAAIILYLEFLFMFYYILRIMSYLYMLYDG